MGLKINRLSKFGGTLADGSGDPLITRDATTNEVGSVANNIGTLATGKIFIGDGSNLPAAQTVSGDFTISQSGVGAISAGVIVDADVNASAAIALTKLAATTASRAIVSDSNGFLVVSPVTSTELGYVSGVTSAIQTQIDSKQATITGAASTVVSSNLSANIVAVTNGSGKLASSSVGTTQLGYISTLTSDAQTQLNARLSTSLGPVADGDIIYYNGSAWTNLPRGTSGQALYSTGSSIQWSTPTINGVPIGGTTGQYLAKLSGTDFDVDWTTLTLDKVTDVTADVDDVNILTGLSATGLTSTELGYVNGVTSSIQTQLENKLNNSLAYNAIFVGNTSGTPTQLSAGTNGQHLTIVGGSPVWTTPVTPGDVSGPGSSTNNAIARWNGTSGNAIQNSGIIIDDSNNVTGVVALTATTLTSTGLTTAASLNISSTLSNDDALTQILVRDVTGLIKYRAASSITGVSDGDYGDITVSGGGATWTVDNSVITFAKIQNSAAGLSVLGRSPNTSGNFAEIVAASDGNIIRRSGTSIDFGSIDLASSGAVGSSILAAANGGTGLSSLGTGIDTWLATPSWTNFNSLITGTAPYWATSGSTTITAPTLVGNPYFQGVSLFAPSGASVTGSPRVEIWGVSGGSILHLHNDAGIQLSTIDNTGASSFTTSASTTTGTAFSIAPGQFNPTSGSATFRALTITPSYNTTATYSGTAIDVDINPTITSTTGLTHIALRGTSGSVLIGNTTLGAATTRFEQWGIGTTTGINAVWKDNGGTERFKILDNGVVSITSAGNGNSWGGSWTATANNQYHTIFNPSITARGTTSDNIYGFDFSPSIIYGANNQVGSAVRINPSFTAGGFTGTFSTILSLQSSGTDLYRFRNDGTLFFGTSTNTRIAPSNSSGTVTAGGPTLKIAGELTSGTQTAVMLTTSASTNNNTTGTGTVVSLEAPSFSAATGSYSINLLRLTGSFSNSSATGGITAVLATPTLTYVSGNAIGFVWNPTVGTIAGNNYAFISSSGLHGLGTLTPTYQFHLKGTSANQNLFVVQEDGGTNLIEAIESGGVKQLGFFNAPPVGQQSVNTILVNNVTSGGSLSTISDYSDLTIYANDAAAIRNNFYRLTEKVLKLETALRNLGFSID